jgi:hypothetical protein
MANEKRLIYAIRDARTGKLVFDLTSRHKLYYTKYAYAENTIHEYRRKYGKTKYEKLEIVEFALDEVTCYAAD